MLAEAVAGSEEGFAELMNQKAKELGLANSSFRNSTGWPDANQQMSCRDIATLARRLITDFPEYYKYDNEKSYKYNGIEQQNRNPLVQKGIADGLKTGHTDAGGYGLVASAQRAGRRVIVVANGMNSMKQRAEESERLLEWSFREFENVTLFTAGDTVESAKVWLGARPTVPMVGGKDLVLTMPRQWRRSAKIAVEYANPVQAPVLRGDTLGKLTVSGQGVPAMEVPLLADLPPATLADAGRLLARLTRAIKQVTGCPAVNVVLNDGPLAGQEVPHVHWHVVPRWPDDGRGYRFAPQAGTALGPLASSLATAWDKLDNDQ